MGQRTSLYAAHLAAGAKMVDFSGWDMPIHYGSQVEEHHAVRREWGMFDVSHMTVVDVQGAQAKAYLQRLLANDVARLGLVGKALYSGLLNEAGGILDDLIVYRMNQDETAYRVIVNCATRQKDLDWLQQIAAQFEVELQERPDLAMVAVQGPQAMAGLAGMLPAELAGQIDALETFQGAEAGEWFAARTGYTGEAGMEVLLPAAQAETFWASLVQAGCRPCGLGARDTLRLEAGMNLYGQDMDESVTPLESNMAWSVAWQPETRDFIGRAALEKQKAAGDHARLRGVVLETKGVLRAHQRVDFGAGQPAGEVTSGSWSPTLGCAVGLARVPAKASDSCHVEIRGKLLPARLVKPCFVRLGEAQIDLPAVS